jgi:hypothetical protein
LVRSPQTIIPSNSGTVVQSDPRRPDAMTTTVRGRDVVLSAIDPHPRDALRPSTLVTDCSPATVEAMRVSGIMRLAIVLAAVLFPEEGLYFAFFKWLIKNHASDLRGLESVVQSIGLDWTSARPPRLTKSTSAEPRVLPNALSPGGRAMSFRSVAAFLLDAIERRAPVIEIFGWGS